MLNQQRGAARNSFYKPKFWLFVLIFAAIICIATVLILIFGKGITQIAVIPTCGDGSFYDACSLDKPYYCSGGILTENVSACGCPDYLIQSGSSCVSIYQSGQKLLNLSYTVNGKSGGINFTVYNGLVIYLSTLPKTIVYRDGQQPIRSDFKLLRINEPNQNVLMMDLVKKIENLAPADKVAQARIAISIVQNIPWGASGDEIDFGSQSVGNSRYPYEVLYDNQGLCGEKSELLAQILREIGYGVVLFYYPNENHETLGIKCPVEESLGGTGYCFVESSGPSIISDSSMKYSGNVKLDSSPEVILISDGIALPSGLYEYRDADILAGLRNKESLGPINSFTFRQLEKKYGLSKVYNIG
ncbi:MAG: hypothetical protein PHH00_03395 [Candidatus Nanoarchaeia archaeon]|nr:hypothetical protein [Candidatus Nanoarchaeia archaeon]